MKGLVKKAKFIVNAQYKEIKNVKDITEKLGCNYNTLRSVFVRETGKTLVSYLNEKRCMYAAIILEKTNWKLYQVAIEVGFNDESYFVKVFKRYYGKCPNQFRKELFK